MENIPIIPGRGLILPSAIKMRHDYLESEGHKINSISDYQLNISEIQNNIESFIGSVEIPLGIVGPLLYKHDKGEELVYTAAGTLEGAMVASMNRGAKAISQSGGFNAAILHQRMVRAPLFIFSDLNNAKIFLQWIGKNFRLIKEITSNYSNHAKLLEIKPIMIGKGVHLKFVYSTGDASGQNMTTTCTWHAILWIAETFQNETEISIERFTLEGNGASDKKISQYSILEGRGVHVTAECNLTDEVIRKVLRTTADDMLAFYHSSKAMATIDGMMGYNINVANAIAAIFVATGQDLGSIHESAIGILNLEKAGDGLYVSLNLPALVIGTIGGGTHLQKQRESLELMRCFGSRKINRFASLIAGFSMALEISTYAAIVSGAFAKAHEKLGRNKPVNWLLKSEINKLFISKIIDNKISNNELISMEITNQMLIENGIITNLTNKISKKLIGFIPITIEYIENQKNVHQQLIIKSKALDLEVIKGLHLLAANIDTQLADLISTHKEKMEYWNCHQKEIALYQALSQNNYKYMPHFWGSFVDQSREIYIFLQEYLHPSGLVHINTQKQPEVWTKQQIEKVISAITEVHQYFESPSNRPADVEIKEFKPWESKPLYAQFISIMIKEASGTNMQLTLMKLLLFLEEFEEEFILLKIPKTIIHNDFNSRNIAIRKAIPNHISQNEEIPCIYDWELAVVNIPHRDIVEFLSFVLVDGFQTEDLNHFLSFHFSLYKTMDDSLVESDWKQGYIYALKEFLVTRVSFYEVAGIHARYAFSERIMKNSFRMLEILSAI